MDGQKFKVRTCSRNIHVSVSKLTGKREQLKYAVRNATFSKAAGQEGNMTGHTTSQQILSYLNVHIFATVVSLLGVKGWWGDGIPPTSTSTSRNSMSLKFVPGIPLVK